MGVTTHLQLHQARPIDLFDKRARILFERKTFIPFAWFLFFAPEDVSVSEDGSAYASVSVRSGLARLKRRVNAIAKVGTPRLVGGLRAFLDSISRAGPGVLVLDPYRVGSSKRELQQRLTWLDALTSKPELRALKKGEALFADDDEGPLWEDSDGNRAMDCAELEDVIGWRISAPRVKWKHPPTPEPAIDPAEVEAARQRAAVRQLEAEAARRPVTDEEFADALTNADDAQVRALLGRQEQARQPGRDEALIAAAFAAKRLTALTERFAELSGEQQAAVARARLEAVLERREAAASLLIDLDRSTENRGLMAPFARRVFDAWKARPEDIARALSPVLYALETATFTQTEWERITRGAQATGNEALIWRCQEHARAASSER